MWEELASLFADDAFRTRAMPLVGPRRYIDVFRGFVARAADDPAVLPHVRRLRAELPIHQDNEPLIALLGEGLEDQPEELAAFLSACAADPAKHDRARIALRAFRERSLAVLNSRSSTAQAAIDGAALALIASPDKRVRWETANVWWALTPRGNAEPLSRLAAAEEEHPLVRAEAARRLGEASNPSVVPLLRRLSTAPHHPLGVFAARSARRVEQALRLVPPEPLEALPQPSELPRDLEGTLRRLGFATDGKVLRPNRNRILLHIVLPDDLSVDNQWALGAVLEGVLRELPCRLVCTESGWHDVSLTAVRRSAGVRAARDVATRYVHDLQINPDEYLSLATEYDFRILGVDDPESVRKILEEKYRGGRGLQYVASVGRARTMIEGTLAALRRSSFPVALLLTHSLPAVQIAALLGEHRQYVSRWGRIAQLEAMLPERVPAGVSVGRDDISYIVQIMETAEGDRFDMDINLIHAAVSTERLRSATKSPRNSPPVWTPDLEALAGEDCSALSLPDAALGSLAATWRGPISPAQTWPAPTCAAPTLTKRVAWKRDSAAPTFSNPPGRRVSLRMPISAAPSSMAAPSWARTCGAPTCGTRC